MPLRPGDGTPLFLVHAVGGNVFSYRPLARALGGSVPIFGIRADGTEPGETPRDDLEAMATAYLEQVRRVQPHGPYRLGGSSLGGNVAFEMAQQLAAAGERVELLALLDAVGPGQMPPRPADDAELLDFLLRDRLPIAIEALRGMDAEARLAAVVGAARASGVLAPEIGADGARRLLGMAERHLHALFTHQHRAYPGRLLYFRADLRRRWDPPNPERPWIELAEGGIEIHRVGGDHLSMHRSPNVEGLAARLGEALARLTPRPPAAQL